MKKSLLLLNCCLHIILLLLLPLSVLGVPQWVWNQDVVGNGGSGNRLSPVSPDLDSPNSVRVVDGTPRLIPSIIGSISNSIQGASGNTQGGFAGLLSSIPQLAAQAVGGLLGRPFNPNINFPTIKDPPGNSGSGSSSPSFPGSVSDGGGGGGSSGGGCKCVENNRCFLPFLPQGSCSGGRVQCCSTRTLFPEDSSSSSSFPSSSSGTKNFQSDGLRTVTQRQLRRGLLQQILKGGGNLVDDTLDLILTPYLSKDDQERLATRVFLDE